MHIDNNLIENCIRPNALARKNYLFAGSHQGAKRSAMFYIFMGTCKRNGGKSEKGPAKGIGQIADHKANKLYQNSNRIWIYNPANNIFLLILVMFWPGAYAFKGVPWEIVVNI